MKPSTCLSLSKHEGPYEKWPSASVLHFNNESTSIKVPGYSLRYQCELTTGYLLVTDYECPYEETTNFVLLNKYLRIISTVAIGPGSSFASNATYQLERIIWHDKHRFSAHFEGIKDRWDFEIREVAIPLIRPALVGRRVKAE